jgi:membrane associated rhomboid family serine protease
VSFLLFFILIAATVIVSNKGFKDLEFFDRYVFRVESITLYKDYKRLITSGFLHVSWMHLILNMFSLYFFSQGLAGTLGPILYLLIYFVSLVGGNLFSLYVHRHDGYYSAVGASGAVSGIIFAAIALFPGMRIGLFFIPIPAWIFGTVFVLYSIYGIKSKKDNIGHEAHLGGALVGMLTAILLRPSVLATNYLSILIVTVQAIIFIYIIIKNPAFLYVDNLFFKEHNKLTIDEKYNVQKVNQQKEVDRILEKINKRGINSLTAKEKQTLDDFGK